MRTTVLILNYTVSVLMLLGFFSLAADGDLDFYTLLGGFTMLSAAIVTLIYVHSIKIKQEPSKRELIERIEKLETNK